MKEMNIRVICGNLGNTLKAVLEADIAIGRIKKHQTPSPKRITIKHFHVNFKKKIDQDQEISVHT